jgi:hypothetical protein
MHISTVWLGTDLYLQTVPTVAIWLTSFKAICTTDFCRTGHPMRQKWHKSNVCHVENLKHNTDFQSVHKLLHTYPDSITWLYNHYHKKRNDTLFYILYEIKCQISPLNPILISCMAYVCKTQAFYISHILWNHSVFWVVHIPSWTKETE